MRIVHTTRALDDSVNLMAKVQNLEPGISSWTYGYVRAEYLVGKKFERSDKKAAVAAHCPSIPWRPLHKLSISVISADLPSREGGIFIKILYGGAYITTHFANLLVLNNIIFLYTKVFAVRSGRCRDTL